MRKLIFVLIILGLLLLIVAGVFIFYLYPERLRPLHEYRGAIELAERGDLVPAALRFESMKDYADSAERARKAWLAAGDRSFDEGDLAQARTYYLKGGASSDVLSKLDSEYYRMGVNAYADDKRVEAENCFSCITSGSSYLALLDQVRISCAERALKSGDFDSAQKVFHLCGESSYPEISSLWFECGKENLTALRLDDASFCFSKAVAYAEDEQGLIRSIDALWYEAGTSARMRGDEATAAECFNRRIGG